MYPICIDNKHIPFFVYESSWGHSFTLITLIHVIFFSFNLYTTCAVLFGSQWCWYVVENAPLFESVFTDYVFLSDMDVHTIKSNCYRLLICCSSSFIPIAFISIYSDRIVIVIHLFCMINGISVWYIVCIVIWVK